ncbi:hypothetical protein UFOVP861_15 [uncultured Caudovirales phage]|jgi:uncharacterized protein involved in type VI secretion and phage assembly|uniref:Uncharacterized protein n=1 Tax=uncultured Caudovirales phage TaxID=2100421 RepID=A0A6J5PDL2_9CAUD|nr:hypothetical protein UFOVP861_15 [uncultured Caudovirales phage]
MKSYDRKSVLIHVYDATVNPPFKRTYRQSHYRNFVKSAPEQIEDIGSNLTKDIFSAIALAVILLIIIFIAFSFS